MPEIEHKIEAGEINLSHVLIADVLFKHEKKRGRPLTIEAKREVFFPRSKTPRPARPKGS